MYNIVGLRIINVFYVISVVSLNKVAHTRLVTHIYMVRGEYQGKYPNKSSLESVGTCVKHVMVQEDTMGVFKKTYSYASYSY